MYHFLKKPNVISKSSTSFLSKQIDHCLSLKSSDFAKSIHAQLIKLGLNTHTFLGNRCVDLFSKVGIVGDALKAFGEIADKNVISWNICLRVFVNLNDLRGARKVFDEMPERDVVSFNSMISGYSSNGHVDCALKLCTEMQKDCIRPSEFTFSILVACVRCARSGKQIHGSMIRNGVKSASVVLGNSLIDMYGKLGLLDYAFGVFLTMEKLDIISWNTLLSSCCKLGFEELALNQFDAMRAAGVSPDAFTISTLTTVCSNLHDLGKGKKILSLCIKSGNLSNTIVSSALIDLFSKCNRLEDSVRIFNDTNLWDSAVCNSMIASYAKHNFEEHAFRIFMHGLEKGLYPTEFTLSCVVSCSSVFPMETGSQLHSLVVKLGFESESIVASSLVEMYGKYGFIDHATFIFDQMSSKDLICWNTMILGLTFNGEFLKSLELFKEMLRIGQTPDRITLAGILMACNHGGLIDEGMFIFSLMEKEFGVKPLTEHYINLIEMMIRARNFKEAFDILTKMPYEPNALILGSILQVVGDFGDFKLNERLANMIIELEPSLLSPYLVLIKSYEIQRRWESVSRIRKMMSEFNPKKILGCSWIGIRDSVYEFQSNQIFQHGGSEIYSVLRLIEQDMDNGWYILER